MKNNEDLKLTGTINLNNFGNWDKTRLIYLFQIADKLNYNLDDLQFGINENTGNIWIWSENENYSLFLGIGADLEFESVQVEIVNNFEFEEEQQVFYLDENLKSSKQIDDKIAELQN